MKNLRFESCYLSSLLYLKIYWIYYCISPEYTKRTCNVLCAINNVLKDSTCLIQNASSIIYLFRTLRHRASGIFYITLNLENTSEINFTDYANYTESFLSSSDTTAKPFPFSPVLAASIEAFNVSKFV